MTIRSIIIGIFLGVLLCGVTFFNDMVMKGTPLIGNFLPISVFGLLLLFVVLINPLMGRVMRAAVLSGGELATIVAIALFACCIPGRGLMQYFTTFLMMPHFHERTTPAWQGEPGIITYDQVQDWEALTAVVSSGASAGSEEILNRVWSRLPAATQALIPAGEATLSGTERDRLLESLNLALEDPVLSEDLPVPGNAPRYVELLASRPAIDLSPAEHTFLNRGLLELAVGDAITPRKSGVLENVPERMLANPGDQALDGFTTGLAQGDESISLSQIPWHSWRRTLLFWIPLILAMLVAVTGLSLVVHRQWSSREHLPYPTIEFARSLLPEEGSTHQFDLQEQAVLGGQLFVFAIHMTNYLHVWFPEYVIPIQTRLDFWPLGEIFPGHGPGRGFPVAGSGPLLYCHRLRLFPLQRSCAFPGGRSLTCTASASALPPPMAFPSVVVTCVHRPFPFSVSAATQACLSPFVTTDGITTGPCSNGALGIPHGR
jgi:hypothetical protein